MLPCTFLLSHPQFTQGADDYVTLFNIKRDKHNKVNACASNLSNVPMHKLDGLIREVKGFKLSTPYGTNVLPVHAMDTCSEDDAWWWQVLKMMLEAATPGNVCDTMENIVRYMCSITT